MTTKGRLFKHFSKSAVKKIIFWAALAVDLVAIPIIIFTILYEGKIYPGIFVAGIPVGGLTKDEAEKIITQKIKEPEEVVLTYQDKKFDFSTKELDLSYNISPSVERAYLLTRTGNTIFDFQKRIAMLFSPEQVGLDVSLNSNKLNQHISAVTDQISLPPKYPSFEISKDGFSVTNGTEGQTADRKLLSALVEKNLSYLDTSAIEIPVIKDDPRLSAEEILSYQNRLDKIFGKSIEIIFEYDTFKISDKEIASFIKPRGGFYEEKIGDKVLEIAKNVDRDPQEPKFNFENGRVIEFAPAKDGIKTEPEELRNKIVAAIDDFSPETGKAYSLEIPVKRTSPEVTTDTVNDLGIKELIGRGTSKFKGSIPSRVHNVALAASKINGTLIPPGDTLSFNQVLGDISLFTGYQQAYVIRDGKTVLGDGGGVCQVSTTLFRAALNAGLPIVERRAHAYRVGYYEQDSGPGFDATVYDPAPDLKIKNDTPAHILIQAKADTKNYLLVFELYGTGDGRTATVGKPAVSGVTAPPEDLYVDDPSLPAGTIKQTEHKAYGATVVFTYKVTRGNETLINTKFTSVYRPWQAVYLRGTGPAI